MFGTKFKDNMVYESNRRKKQKNPFLPPKEVKFSSVKVRSTKSRENRTPFAGLDNYIFSESRSFEKFNVDTDDFDYMALMHRRRDDGSVFSAVDDNHGFDRYKSIYSPKNSDSHRRSKRDIDLSNTLVNPLHREPPRFQRMTAKEYMKSVPNRERNMLSMKERLERDILDTIGGMGEDENGNIVYKPRSAHLILKSNNLNFEGEVVAPKHKKDKLMSPLRKYKSLADATSTNSYIASGEMNNYNYLEKDKKKSSFDVLMDEESVEEYDGIQSMRSDVQSMRGASDDIDYITSKSWSPKRIMNQLRSPRNQKENRKAHSEDTEQHDEIQSKRSTSYDDWGYKNPKRAILTVPPKRGKSQKHTIRRDTKKMKEKPHYIWTFGSSDSHSTDGTSTLGSSITGSIRSTNTNFEGCVNGLQRELRDLKILQQTVYDHIDKQCKSVQFPELKCKGVKMGKMKLKAIRCNGTGRTKTDQSSDGPSSATPKSSTAIEDGSMKDIEERKVCSPISPTNYQDIRSSLMEIAKLKPIYPAIAENNKNNEVEEEEEDEKSLVKDKKKKRRVVGMLKKVKAAVNNGVQRKKAKSVEKQMPSKEVVVEEEEVEENDVSENHETSESSTYALKWSRLPALMSRQKEVQQTEEQEVKEEEDSAVCKNEEPNGNNFSPMKWPRLPPILSPTQQKLEEQEGEGSFVPDENKQTNHESNESPTKWSRLSTMLSLTSPVSHAPTKASKDIPLSPPAMFHE